MSTSIFERGDAGLRERGVFEPVLLPDDIKRDLCLGLLEEFGAVSIRESHTEITHGCLVSTAHRDQERNPTASLNWETLTFNCLGCQSSGGILWFIATLRGCSSTEALDWLNTQTGLGGREIDISSLMRYFDALYSPQRHGRVPIPRYSERVLDAWSGIHPYLTDPRSEEGRQIDVGVAQELRFGYAQEYPVGKDVTSERIVLPHFWKGKLVGWQTRRLADDGTPKYLSSPDFPKDQTIYHYVPREERVVVVEAMLSVASKMHLAHCEGTFGAKVTDAQVALLGKHPVVILFMDNDDAGWKATEHLGEELSRTAIVLAVENPWSADPADIDDEDFLALISTAVPYSVWRRPEMLYCYQCRQQAHSGPCTERNDHGNP